MFIFDVETAVNSIAAIEAAIATPVPGIQNAFLFGDNPQEITDEADFPAIVHIIRGPSSNTGPGMLPDQLTYGSQSLFFEIDSLLLIIETTPGAYPEDEKLSSVWWLSIANEFWNEDNETSLIKPVGAFSYQCSFPNPSFSIRQWPPPSPLPPLHWYWSVSYTHRFTIEN